MNKKQRTKIINDYKTKKGGTGSIDIQVVLLSHRIAKLQDHFKKNPKDKHSNRGLVAMVNNRRKYLKYLMKRQPEGYKNIVKELKLKI